MKVFCIALCLVVVFSLGEAKSVHNVRKIRSIVNSFIPDMSRFVRDLSKMRVERDTEEDVEEAVDEFLDAVFEDDDKKRDTSSPEDEDETLEDLFDLTAPKRKAAAPKMAVKRSDQAKRTLKDWMPRMVI
ncbi:uncharacterized protein [Centruroides vittatus]|uniref:uncharacterized protein n=1 Tax=Centruroides vittatus TaxID=120091 RepID=UPI00350F3B98